MDNDTITAIHEAGHAVAAIRTGLVFDHVTALPDDEEETDGALHWTDLQDSGVVAESPVLHAIVLLAGPLAEAKLLGRRVDRVFAEWEAADDREAVATLALEEEEFLAASRDAAALVEQDWALIEQVAGELMRGQRLSYDEVCELVDAADAQH